MRLLLKLNLLKKEYLNLLLLRFDLHVRDLMLRQYYLRIYFSHHEVIESSYFKLSMVDHTKLQHYILLHILYQKCSSHTCELFSVLDCFFNHKSQQTYKPHFYLEILLCRHDANFTS
jgi:hypothetical protein